MNQRAVLWTLGGCLAMAIGLAAIFVFDVPVNSVLLVALVLACPLAHLVMMRSGMHDHGQHQHRSPERPDTADPAPSRPDTGRR